MALRVLLADESSTIKKVIQLALQDYAVEVKVVPNGLDVVQVAQSMQPDIAFIDVLLTQRSGYEVAAELKSHPQTSKIPVVLMWSGFMALDEARYKLSKADDRLEKPFETDGLRNLIHKWVPRTKQSTLSSYLQFPPMPDFIQNEEAEAFAHVPLKKESESPSEGWQHHSIKNDQPPPFMGTEVRATPKAPPAPTGQFPPLLGGSDEGIRIPSNLPTPPPNAKEELTVWGAPPKEDKPPMQIPEVPLEDLHFDEFKPGDSELPSSYEEVGFDTSGQLQASQIQKSPSTQALLHEKMIREEAAKIIENIAWKILPDIAERILREEIDKILREEEKKFQP